MGIALEIGCAMCGKEKTVHIDTDGFDGNVEKPITDEGWIVQKNGEHFDVYCSKKCAD